MDQSTANTRIGPMDGLVTAAAFTAVASVAAVIPYVGELGSDEYLTFQALDNNVNVIFGASAAMGAPTLVANSLRITAGDKEDWVPPPGATHYRTIGAGNGTLLIAKSSP